MVIVVSGGFAGEIASMYLGRIPLNYEAPGGTSFWLRGMGYLNPMPWFQILPPRIIEWH